MPHGASENPYLIFMSVNCTLIKSQRDTVKPKIAVETSYKLMEFLVVGILRRHVHDGGSVSDDWGWWGCPSNKPNYTDNFQSQSRDGKLALPSWPRLSIDTLQTIRTWTLPEKGDCLFHPSSGNAQEWSAILAMDNAQSIVLSSEFDTFSTMYIDKQC